MDCAGGDHIYQIYLDIYFLFNFWMNLWVLFLCRFFLHSKVKIKKVILSAALASVGECIILIFPYGDGQFKSFFGFGMITAGVLWFLFRPGNRKNFTKILVTTYMTALVLGGTLEILENVFGLQQISVMGLSSVMVLVSLGIKVIYRWSIDYSAKDFMEVFLVFSTGERCKVLALVDSGNSLVEPISGKPVSLVEQRVMDQYMSALTPNSFRLVPFRSVGRSDGILEAYFIEKMEMKKEGERIEVERPIIGITKEVISSNEKYQMILHPALLEN